MFVAYSLLLGQGAQKNWGFQWTCPLKAGPAINLQHTYTMIQSIYAVTCVRRALIVSESAKHDKFSNSSEIWTGRSTQQTPFVRAESQKPTLALTTLFTIIIFLLLHPVVFALLFHHMFSFFTLAQMTPRQRPDSMSFPHQEQNKQKTSNLKERHHSISPANSGLSNPLLDIKTQRSSQIPLCTNLPQCLLRLDGR
jgi:hypothetical protein